MLPPELLARMDEGEAKNWGRCQCSYPQTGVRWENRSSWPSKSSAWREALAFIARKVVDADAPLTSSISEIGYVPESYFRLQRERQRLNKAILKGEIEA